MATLTDEFLDALASGKGSLDYLPSYPAPEVEEYKGAKPAGLNAFFGAKNSLIGALPNQKSDEFEEPFGSVGGAVQTEPTPPGTGGITVTGGAYDRAAGNLTGPIAGGIKQTGGGGGRQQTAGFSTGSIGSLSGNIGSLGNSFGFAQA